MPAGRSAARYGGAWHLPVPVPPTFATAGPDDIIDGNPKARSKSRRTPEGRGGDTSRTLQINRKLELRGRESLTVLVLPPSWFQKWREGGPEASESLRPSWVKVRQCLRCLRRGKRLLWTQV